MTMARKKTAAPTIPPKPDVRSIGGMVETAWAGRKMWRCPRCRATTFTEPDSRTHTCKEVRYADEDDA